MQSGTRRCGFPLKAFCDSAKRETYQCPVCLDVCRSPVTCQSGAHLFCLDCLTQSLRRNSSCPVCREPLTTPLPSAFASAQVSALDVVCVHDKCTWKGICGSLDCHLAECSDEPIACYGEDGCGALVPRGEMATHRQFVCLQMCPNSKAKKEGSDGDVQLGTDTCDVRLSRNDLVEHLKHHCKHRHVHCPHPSCGVSVAYNRMAAHIEVCPLAHASCPRQCGAPNLTRKSLDAHRSDCPNEPVSCVHAPLGCSHVAPRGQIGQHERDVGLHFVALSKTFVQLQQSHELLQRSHKQQIHQMQQMEGTLQAQSSVLERLQLQATLFEEGFDVLQPVMAKARAEAEAAEAAARAAQARARAEAVADEVMGKLRCYKCHKPAVVFFKNDLEPERNDLCRVCGFSGTCSSFTHVFFAGRWGVGIQNKKELVEKILTL